MAITIWNAVTGKLERQLAGYSSEAQAALQGHSEAERSDHNMVTHIMAPYVVRALAFSPDGTRLASVDVEGEIKAWDFQNGTLVYTVNLRGRGSLLTYSGDGKVLAASVVPRRQNSKARIETYDAATGKILRTILTEWEDDPLALRVTANDVLASGCADSEGSCAESASVWNLASGQVEKRYPADKTQFSDSNYDAFSPGGRWMARIGSAGVEVLDLSKGEGGWSFTPGYAGLAIFSPDEQEIAVTGQQRFAGSNYHREIIDLRSTATHAVVGTLQAEGYSESPFTLTHAAFSADGKRLAAAPYRFATPGTIKRLIKIWDVTTGRELLTLGDQDHN